MAPSFIRGQERTLWLLVRTAVYGAVLTVLMVAHMRAVADALHADGGSAAGIDRARALIGEDGPLEWRQAGMLLLAMGLALVGTVRGRRPLDLVLALALGVAAVRELDDVLALHVGRNAHRPIMAVLLVGAVSVVVHFRRSILADLGAFLRRPGFWLLFSGALTVGSLAQVLGQTPIWEGLSSGELASRVAKRFVEEGLEFAGYTLMLLGVIEEICFRRSLPEARPDALDKATTPAPKPRSSPG